MARSVWMWSAALCACTTPTHDSRSALASDPTCRDVTLAWGDGAGQVGLRPAMTDALASGPQAIAVAASGEQLVLDSIHERVLAVGSGGTRVAVTGVARDSEDLAAGADGAIAVFSPLRARAWVFGGDGRAAGEVAVDRTLRQVSGLALGPSRQIAVRNAFQETFEVGSPAAPVALASTLESKREGAFVLDDGRGLQVRAAGGQARLVVVANSGDKRSAPVATYALPGRVDAAMVVGTTGHTACVRAEQVDQAGALVVTRRAICVDADSGRVVLDTPLAKPGLYMPRQELAVGGSQLAQLWPTSDGLVVHTCEVPR